MAQLVTIPYTPRAQQLQLHKEATRFNVFVIHRRFGKTVWAINNLIRNVLEEKLDRPRGGYIAPTQVQARRIAWDYLKHFSEGIPGVKFNQQALSADYPNGARINLLSGESYESLRGMYLDDCVIDESADINPIAWSQVIRPALSDRIGSCTFIGTPKGRNNLLSDLYHKVPELGDEWSRQLLTYRDTGIIDPGEIEALRQELTEAEFQQELECSFLAAVQGSYWSKEINELESSDHIKQVMYDPTLPVHTSWDLGWRDSMIVWFFQLAGGEIRVIDLLSTQFTSLPDVIGEVKMKGYQYARHIAPHDISVHELGSGQSRFEIAQKLGITFDICPKIPVIDGIKAVQAMLPRCYIDRAKCSKGIDALRQYRSEYDPLKRVYSKNPLHDWCSDYADAFRYFVVFMDGGSRQLNFDSVLDYGERDRAAI